MRKTKLATYAVALSLAAAAMTGISTETAHAEEATQVVATDTDAAVEETAEAVTEAEVVTDEVTVADGGNDAYYNVNIHGGEWDGTHYFLNGQLVTNAFFCDGLYTYYLQADGTPMKDRLTYHPDGVHIIYFDAYGHEVFNNFTTVTKSISGDAVNDVCFFNVFGYMYVNQLTYDMTGTKIYFINEYGVIESNKWVKVNYAKYFDQDFRESGYAYAQADGSLATNQFMYDRNGNLVYAEGDGLLATGLRELGDKYYLFDLNDGHLLQTYTSLPGEYTLTRYYDETYVIQKYVNGEFMGEDEYRKSDQTQIAHQEYSVANGVNVSNGWYMQSNKENVVTTYTDTYDDNWNQLTGYETTTEVVNGVTQTEEYKTDYLYYDAESGKVFLQKRETRVNNVLRLEEVIYQNNDDSNSWAHAENYFYNQNGIPTSKEYIVYYSESVQRTDSDGDVYETNPIYSMTTTLYDAAGNETETITSYFDKDGNEIKQ